MMETPIDHLIREHRHIEKMVKLIRGEIKSVRNGGRADLAFIEVASDFFENYVQRTHQEKEAILFDFLSRKRITEDDFALLCEIIREHEVGKQIADELFEARNAYDKGNADLLPFIIDKLSAWVRCYSEHVKKEEDLFFPCSQRYIGQEESLALLRKFRDFNEVLIRRNKELLKKVKQNKPMAQTRD